MTPPPTEHSVRRDAEPVVVEAVVQDLDALFDPYDPSPLSQRSLVGPFMEYVTSRIGATPANRPVTLRLLLPREAMPLETEIREGVRRQFERSAVESRNNLREHFRTGRRMAATGVVAAIILIFAAQFIASVTDSRLLSKIAAVLGMVVWVIMWRPVEMLLYDWRPKRRVCQIHNRLESIDIKCGSAAGQVM